MCTELRVQITYKTQVSHKSAVGKKRSGLKGSTCGGDEHHGNVTVLHQVANVRAALLYLEDNVTVYTIGLEVLACSSCALDAVPKALHHMQTTVEHFITSDTL